MRHFPTGRISEFRRHSHSEMPLQFGERPIITKYVNFLAPFRSRLETVRDDFDGRWPGARPAILDLTSAPWWLWISGFHSVCQTLSNLVHPWRKLDEVGQCWRSASITVTPDRSRSRVAAAAREREFEKRKKRIPGTGTPAPLPNVLPVGFFNISWSFLPSTRVQHVSVSPLVDPLYSDGAAGAGNGKSPDFVDIFVRGYRFGYGIGYPF